MRFLHLFLAAAIVALAVLGAFSTQLVSAGSLADELTSPSMDIGSTTEAPYEAKAAILVKFNDSSNNFTSLYFYAKITKEGYSTVLATTSKSYSDYYTDNGTITITMAGYLDHQKSGWNVKKGDTVLGLISVYNGTAIDSSKLLDTAIATDIYPFVVTVAEDEDEDESKSDNRIYIIAIVGLLLLMVVAGGSFQLFAPESLKPSNFLRLGGPPNRDTVQYKDGRKVWAKRNEKGQFTDIQDPKHAMNRDRATPHRHKSGWDRKR